MAALARHWPYIQLTSSTPFQSSPKMVSPREGNKVGRDSTDSSVFAPSGINFALVADQNPLLRRVKCRPLLQRLASAHRPVPPSQRQLTDRRQIYGRGCVGLRKTCLVLCHPGAEITGGGKVAREAVVQEDQPPKLESAQHPGLPREEHRGRYNRCRVLGDGGVMAGCDG